MNSSAGKRYIKTNVQKIVKGDWKVFDISNANVIFEADEKRSIAVALSHNHYYCLPSKPLKYFVMNFITVYNSLIQNNGASYNLHKRILNPDAGYMVAIPGFEKIVDIPKNLNEFQDVITSYCINREMWDKMNSNPANIYLGLWLNEGKLYIDLTENIAVKDDAIQLGNERNQIAIYDCYERHDIRIKIC